MALHTKGISDQLRSLMNMATDNITNEPKVTYDKDGNVTSDEFCRFSEDYQGFIDADHIFHSLDSFQEFSSEMGNPETLVAQHERMLGGPMACCTDSTIKELPIV